MRERNAAAPRPNQRLEVERTAAFPPSACIRVDRSRIGRERGIVVRQGLPAHFSDCLTGTGWRALMPAMLVVRDPIPDQGMR